LLDDFDRLYLWVPIDESQGLKYLVALAEHRSFRQGGRALVRQPADSIRSVEEAREYLGVKLVERQPKNIQLTEVASKSWFVRGACWMKARNHRAGAQQYDLSPGN